MFLNSTFQQEEIDKERGVILEEINLYEDDPRSHIGSVYEHMLHGDQPAGWEIIGTRKTVGSFRRKDFIEYYKQHYVARKTVVVVAGNLNTDDTLKKLKKLFSKAPKLSPPPKQPVKQNQSKPLFYAQKKETDQTHLMVGFRSYNIFHKDRFALSLLANILGGGMSSRMFVSVREQKGLAYYVNTANDMDPDTGHLTTQAGVNTSKLRGAVSTILDEYKTIRDVPVSADELKRSKENIRGRMSLRLESSYAVALYLADQELQTHDILTPAQILEEIDSVTPQDIQRVAKAIMKPKNLNLTIIGPEKAKEGIEELLVI